MTRRLAQCGDGCHVGQALLRAAPRLVRAAIVAAALLLAALCPPASQAQTQDQFFDDTVVHEINLRMNPSDWQRMKERYQDNTYYPAEFRWRSVVIEDVGIRVRGISSRTPIKPGFNVDFNRFEDKQEFLGMTTLKLDNNVTESSMLRERLAMLIFKRMGLPYLRETHARVLMNGQFIGVYTIVENPNKNFLRRTFNDDNGYLYEYKFVPDYRFEYLGSDPGRYSPTPFQPETHEQNPNPAPLEAMIRTINQASDSEFPARMAEYLDLKLFLAHLAVEVFLTECDGILGENGMANFYFYRFTGKNLSQFIPWDRDCAFGPVDDSIFKNTQRNVLIRRTLAVPELRNYFMEAIAMCAALAGGAGGWLEQEVSSEYAQIRDAVRSDSIKPCVDDILRSCPLDRGNQLFESSIEYLREFARRRGATVLKELQDSGFQLAASGPRLAERGIFNAAPNAEPGPVAAGSYLSVYGQQLGATAQTTVRALGPGSTILVNGFAAPIVFISPGQINIQAPWEIAAGVVPVTAIVDGAVSNPIEAEFAAHSPGLFAVTHANYSLVTAENPATSNEVLLLWANGLGAVTQPVNTGALPPSNPLALTREQPGIIVGGVPGELLFSGLDPGFLGLYLVAVRLPADLPAGPQTALVLSIAGKSALPFPIATR